VKNGYPAVFLTSEQSDDGPTGRSRVKHCQQFGNARMSASGSVHWPEGAMDGCYRRNNIPDSCDIPSFHGHKKNPGIKPGFLSNYK
jgi:hypothetical protein